MEEQSNQQNTLQLMFNSEGTNYHISHSTEENPNPHFVAAGTGKDESQWTFLPKPSHSYVEFLTKASTFLPKTTTEEVFGSNYSSVGSIRDVNDVNRIDRSFFYSDPAKAYTSNTTDSSTDKEDRTHVGFWIPEKEGEQANKFASTQHHLHAEGHASWVAETTRDKLDQGVTVGAPGFLPRSQCSTSKKKENKTDRQRRLRISENVRALHDLLPNALEGNQAYILDDIIDYVKYLQLQIKELSASKLQGESISVPLTFHEGFGHYINQQMLNEPLEEMMGKLLEEHPAAATQLLESRGLCLLPMTLVEDLRQGIKMFGGISNGF
ncbi:hypothetical protein L6164_034572 [Bauhinia variegata]|uniref:Uncharacterized protein n=1 Tax=Bauhinia variegata TaxID=167791 RepID=A0ACB9KV45_BAUVA|nr:hypothetical protein L6164_034572 [Bauhinia variegata]